MPHAHYNPMRLITLSCSIGDSQDRRKAAFITIYEDSLDHCFVVRQASAVTLYFQKFQFFSWNFKKFLGASIGKPSLIDLLLNFKQLEIAQDGLKVLLKWKVQNS